jgi:hypothetical protein
VVLWAYRLLTEGALTGIAHPEETLDHTRPGAAWQPGVENALACGDPRGHKDRADGPPCQNPPASSSETMDIERVNAIGTLLADLTARTAALRGYL